MGTQRHWSGVAIAAAALTLQCAGFTGAQTATAPPSIGGTETAPAKSYSLEELAKKAAENPDSIEATLAYADALHFAGKYTEAINQYQNVIRVDQRNADALAGRACCYKHLDKPALALASYRSAWTFHPYNISIIRSYVSAAHSADKLSEASSALKTLAKKDPQSAADIYWTVAEWVVDNDFWLAQEYSKEANRLDPEDYPSATISQKQLDYEEGSAVFFGGGVSSGRGGGAGVRGGSGGSSRSGIGSSSRSGGSSRSSASSSTRSGGRSSSSGGRSTGSTSRGGTTSTGST